MFRRLRVLERQNLELTKEERPGFHLTPPAEVDSKRKDKLRGMKTSLKSSRFLIGPKCFIFLFLPEEEDRMTYFLYNILKDLPNLIKKKKKSPGKPLDRPND